MVDDVGDEDGDRVGDGVGDDDGEGAVGDEDADAVGGAVGEDVGDDDGTVVGDTDVGAVGEDDGDDWVPLPDAIKNFRSIPHVLSLSVLVTFNLFPVTSTSNVSLYQASMVLQG